MISDIFGEEILEKKKKKPKKKNKRPLIDLYGPQLPPMEHSSPLAAMQPPSVLFGHCFRQDAASPFTSCGSSAQMSGLGPNSFNFKDLSMNKSHQDYFPPVKQVPTSSPSASLAADLSQNFHIDQRLVALACLQILLLSGVGQRTAFRLP